MDGKSLLYALRQLLNEDSDSFFLDDYTSYRFLNQAAVDLGQRINMPRGTQTITTVAEQTDYDVNADFIGLLRLDQDKDFFIKYNDGTADHFITWKPYEEIVYANQETSVSVPDNFSIDTTSLDSRVTGTATSTAADSGGEAVLTDAAGDFSDVEAGDTIHNTSDGSTGVVVSVTSSTVLTAALFGGTENDWTSGDAYVIQPQHKYRLILDPPPSTAAHTITLYYLQRPGPVYSDYGMFNIPAHFMDAIVQYAAWLYKYRDREPNFGDAWYQHYDLKVRRHFEQSNNILHRRRMVVSLKKRQ